MKSTIILILVFLFFSCKKENSDNNCIGCEDCIYTNYYILNKINAKCYKNNIYELMQTDTCSVKDFSIKLFLIGDMIIESSYNNYPTCVRKMYFINKLLKFEIDNCPFTLKPKDNNLLIKNNELGYSPIELIIDTNTIQYVDTTIFISGKINLIDIKGNVYSALITGTYIKI